HARLPRREAEPVVERALLRASALARVELLDRLRRLRLRRVLSTDRTGLAGRVSRRLLLRGLRLRRDLRAFVSATVTGLLASKLRGDESIAAPGHSATGRIVEHALLVRLRGVLGGE